MTQITSAAGALNHLKTFMYTNETVFSCRKELGAVLREYERYHACLVVPVLMQLRGGGDVKDTHGSVFKSAGHHVAARVVDNTSCTLARRKKLVELVIAGKNLA